MQYPRRLPRAIESLESRLVLDSTVVINEIMYHPATAPLVEGDYEWVEIFNQMAIPMDISGWRLQGGISYTFPSTPSTVIPGRGYFVIASNPSALSSGIGFSGAKGPFTGRLANDTDTIELVNKDGRLLSTVEYVGGGDWPVGPDGSGFSLAKFDQYSSTSDVSSWVTSRQLNGTPGAANFPSGLDPGPPVIFNEISAASGSNFWLEIANQGSTSFALNGSQIVTAAGTGATYTFPNQTLAPGQILQVTQAQLGFSGANADKLYFYSAGKDRLLDARAVSTRLQGLAPGHGTDWLYPSVATPGAANSFTLHDEIVVNEVMYHAMPQQPTTPTYDTTKILAVDAGTLWRYNQTGVSLSSTWAQTAHSGTGWFSGAGLLAFEPDPMPFPVRTVLDDPQATGVGDPFVVTTYFETEFTFNGSLSSVDQLLLGHVIDDGAIFYLNGVEVLRTNMPSSGVTSATFASTNIEGSYLGPVSIPKTALVQGVNRLSVEVHQSVTTSSDLTFGAEVFVTTVVTPAGPPFQESDEEWIELYNRSAAAVDIGGWSFVSGIEYTFLAGTTIPAGGYLVVANHRAALQAEYPTITVVGDFDKSLSNSSDIIRLLDANQNPADEVHYYDGGYWPSLADGGGSSMELRSPDADNSKPEAWVASDERDQGEWNTYTLRATATSDTGPTGVWNEFLFGMLDDGEVLIDDVSVIRNPGTVSATQMLQNGSFQSDTVGAAAQKWRIVGNHHGTVVEDPDNPLNKVLDLRATGGTDHEHNNAGTTFSGNTAIVNGTVYEISFARRWVGGSPQLNARFYLSRAGQTFILETPQKAGTPGAPNSTLVSNVGPTYSGFQHGPVVPAANQAVTVSVKAQDSNGVAAMTLFWSVDGGAWTGGAMTLNSSGVYTGAIPGQVAGKVVQFYVRGQDGLGAISTYPAAGANSRALYQVNDSKGPSTAIDSIRVVMLTADSNSLLVNTNLMSSEGVGATVIYNNSQVFYDVSAQLKGSSYSRRDPVWLGSYSLRFQPDHLFRGVHEKIALDSTGRTSGSGSTEGERHDEILVDQILNHAGKGLASNYDDLAYLIVPRTDHTGTVILELARYEDVFLDESFENGSDGNVFEYELVYYHTSTVDGNPESLKTITTTTGGVISTPLKDLGNDKQNYRWNLLLKNNHDADDYSKIIAMSKAFSLTGTTFLTTISSLIDVDQWLRTFAVANLMGISDSFATGSNNQHNTVFYVRPSDGRVLFFPWDWDESFRLSSSSALVLGGSTLPLSKLLTSPEYAHLYYGHLRDLINTTVNTTYISPWATSLGALAGQSFSVDTTYVTNRANYVTNTALPLAAPQVAFDITTNNGANFTVGTLSTVLAGNGWIDVREIRLAGSTQALPITWTTQSKWQVTVPLLPGVQNNLTLQAYDFQGNLAASDTISITSTAIDPGLVAGLRVTEMMYHPSPDPTGAITDEEQFEYIELQNVGSTQLNLQNARFTVGITYTFPSTILAPGARTILVKNSAAFTARYGSSIPIGGVFSGNLSNSGEQIVLVDASNLTIQDFSYLDDDWYPAMDGDGYSMVIVNPAGATSAWSTKAGWRRSSNLQGSPGAVDPTAVFDRYVFYNNSAFDGNNPAANASDDAAIASDKDPLRPGQTATLVNYTSYTRGINGVMIDVAGLASAALTTADVQFLTGNSDDQSGWIAAPAPASVTVRAGAGVNGSDRVTLVWNDWDAVLNPANEAIAKAWLKVTVLGNAHTGLAANDVFYFGNAVADTGNSPTDTYVNSADQLGARNNPKGTNAAPIDYLYDFNRDNQVDTTDQMFARNNPTTMLTALKLIGAPAAVVGGGSLAAPVAGSSPEGATGSAVATGANRASTSINSQASIIDRVLEAAFHRDADDDLLAMLASSRRAGLAGLVKKRL